MARLWNNNVNFFIVCQFAAETFQILPSLSTASFSSNIYGARMNFNELVFSAQKFNRSWCPGWGLHDRFVLHCLCGNFISPWVPRYLLTQMAHFLPSIFNKFCFLPPNWSTILNCCYQVSIMRCFFFFPSCFERFFRAVNLNERYLSLSHGEYRMEDVNLHGVEYLWRTVLHANDKVADRATRLLKETYTLLGPSLLSHQVRQCQNSKISIYNFYKCLKKASNQELTFAINALICKILTR